MSDNRVNESCPCGATYSLNVMDADDQRVDAWRHEHRKCRNVASERDHYATVLSRVADELDKPQYANAYAGAYELRTQLRNTIWDEQRPRPDLDTAHEVALERERIASYLQRESTAAITRWEFGSDPGGQTAGTALDIAWQAIQRGDHWKVGD